MAAFWKSALVLKGTGKSAVGFFLIALIVVGVPQGTSGFERLCQPVEFCVWDAADMPIPWTINLNSLAANPIASGSYEQFDVFGMISRAFQAWEQARSSFVRFQYAGPNVTFDPANPRPLIEVYFTPREGPNIRIVKGLRPSGHRATVYGGIAIPAMVGSLLWGRCNFYEALVHELGHVLGLDHPRLDRPAGSGDPLMAQGGGGNTCPSLHPDDIAGAHFLYPALAEQPGQQRVEVPEIEIWPASGAVAASGADLQIAVSHPAGRVALAQIQVLANGQDATAGVGWLFTLPWGRLTPFGYVLSVPRKASEALGALIRAGVPCARALDCSFFPPVGVRSLSLTVIVRDTSGNETRVERAYTIVP